MPSTSSATEKSVWLLENGISNSSNKEFGCSQIDISVLISSQPKEKDDYKKKMIKNIGQPK